MEYITTPITIFLILALIVMYLLRNVNTQNWW